MLGTGTRFSGLGNPDARMRTARIISEPLFSRFPLPIPEHRDGRRGAWKAPTGLVFPAPRSHALQDLRVTRAPYSAVIPGLASQEFLAHLHGYRTQGPWLLMTTSRFNASESSEVTLDPSVSCPEGNAGAVRFAARNEPLPSIRFPRTSSMMELELIVRTFFSVFHRSDACRAGRRPDIPKVRCTSKSSRARASALYASFGAVGLILIGALEFNGLRRKFHG